jgi:hypothetical protein
MGERILDFPGSPYAALFAVFIFPDLGGTGARADALAIWIVHFVECVLRIWDLPPRVGSCQLC